MGLSGDFTSPNGSSSWNVVNDILPGTIACSNSIVFESEDPFGDVQLVEDLDDDVLGFGDDALVQLGTPGDGDVNAPTIGRDDDLGVAHVATSKTATKVS